MTKKHTHPEYATTRELEQHKENNYRHLEGITYIYIMAGLITCITVALWGFSTVLNPTPSISSQLEAEGLIALNTSEWRIECIENKTSIAFYVCLNLTNECNEQVCESIGNGKFACVGDWQDFGGIQYDPLYVRYFKYENKTVGCT